MYVQPNFKTKKQLKEAVKEYMLWKIAPNEWKNDEYPPAITVFQPGGILPTSNAVVVTVEGPHYPKPHTWYARVRVEDGVVVKVLR